MNVRRAATIVAAGVLLTVGLTAAPAYAEVVDLKALPAAASGAAGQTVAVTIAFEASAAIPASGPAVEVMVAFPAGVLIKEYAPGCVYWGTFKARCQMDSVSAGRHELRFQVIMSTASVATGSFTLTMKAQGYSEPTYGNNKASITLKRTAVTSSSPSPTSSKKATPTPKSSKRSTAASPTPAETDAAPTETAETAAETDGASAAEVSAVSAAGNEDSSSLPVLIFGGAGALVVVGGLLLWLVLRRRSDEDDEDEDYADERYDRFR
ncbi:MAG: hypothetical protein HOV76_04385 [Hamadaea sp.]|nr:hypothetical protein [Hamadaea sp.]